MISKIVAAAVLSAALSSCAPVVKREAYGQDNYDEPKTGYEYSVKPYYTGSDESSKWNDWKPTTSSKWQDWTPTTSSTWEEWTPTTTSTWEEWTPTTSSTWEEWTPTTSSHWQDWTPTTSSTWEEWTPTTSSHWQDWTPTTSSTWEEWTPTTSSAWEDWSSTTGGAVITILPEYTSQYHVKTGAVDFDVTEVEVSKSTSNGGDDLTALVTFEVDASYANYQCQIVFDLIDGSASGTQKAQLFTSLAPATADASSWPSGNLRDQHEGTVDVVVGGRATWEAGSGPAATTNGIFPCSTIAGKIFGGEVVPQGDNDYIYWSVNGNNGPKILVF